MGAQAIDRPRNSFQLSAFGCSGKSLGAGSSSSQMMNESDVRTAMSERQAISPASSSFGASTSNIVSNRQRYFISFPVRSTSTHQLECGHQLPSRKARHIRGRDVANDSDAAAVHIEPAALAVARAASILWERHYSLRCQT